MKVLPADHACQNSIDEESFLRSPTKIERMGILVGGMAGGLVFLGSWFGALRNGK